MEITKVKNPRPSKGMMPTSNLRDSTALKGEYLNLLSCIARYNWDSSLGSIIRFPAIPVSAIIVFTEDSW